MNKGLHQVNRIFTLKFEQEYEPKERGLDHVTIVRNVPILETSFYKILINSGFLNLNLDAYITTSTDSSNFS